MMSSLEPKGGRSQTFPSLVIVTIAAQIRTTNTDKCK